MYVYCFCLNKLHIYIIWKYIHIYIYTSFENLELKLKIKYPLNVVYSRPLGPLRDLRTPAMQQTSRTDERTYPFLWDAASCKEGGGWKGRELGIIKEIKETNRTTRFHYILTHEWTFWKFGTFGILGTQLVYFHMRSTQYVRYFAIFDYIHNYRKWNLKS